MCPGRATPFIGTLERDSEKMSDLKALLFDVSNTLREEEACLKLWFKAAVSTDKSLNDVQQGIENSLTRISLALGKLAALEEGDDHGGKANSLLKRE
jgi:hypothetical protein